VSLEVGKQFDLGCVKVLAKCLSHVVDEAMDDHQRPEGGLPVEIFVHEFE
jgi:hypothetical protein